MYTVLAWLVAQFSTSQLDEQNISVRECSLCTTLLVITVDTR